MARGPARLQFRVQLRFVTEEQLFGPGPLSPPTPQSLRLDVHPAGEEADATVTDGEVPSPAGKLGPRGAGGARPRAGEEGGERGGSRARGRRGGSGRPPCCLPSRPTFRLHCARPAWEARTAGPRTCLGHNFEVSAGSGEDRARCPPGLPLPSRTGQGAL